MLLPLFKAAFAWLLFDRLGNLVEKQNGTLFTCPEQVLLQDQINFYSTLEKPGWHKCKLGYAVRVFKLSSEHRLIFPGLKVLGFSTIHGKSATPQIKETPKFFDEYFHNILSEITGDDEEQNPQLGNLVHDVRRMNAVLYNASIELEKSVSLSEHDKQLIGNIIAISEILSGRLDLEGLPEILATYDQALSRIAIYKKLDKTVRSFRLLAKQKRIEVVFEGTSYTEILGPQIFEVAVYTIMDNMVKYAPQNTQIHIKISEDDDSIVMEFGGIGPKLKQEECQRVFDRGFRGMEAMKHSSSGSGIGLFVASYIIRSYFQGEIYVYQENPMGINGIDYNYTKFTVTIPKNLEQGIFRTAV